MCILWKVCTRQWAEVTSQFLVLVSSWGRGVCIFCASSCWVFFMFFYVFSSCSLVMLQNRWSIDHLRAAAPAADPGKMGKEETARLTFPICVCRVVYVCLYVYTLSSLCSLLYNIASLQTKKQTSRKNVFFPTFSAFSISHQLTCCCCCPKAPPGTKTAVADAAAAAAANRRVARAPPGTKTARQTARHGRTNRP